MTLDELQQLVTQIAHHLPGDWTTQPTPLGIELVRDDHRTRVLSITVIPHLGVTGKGHRPRLQVSGRYPLDSKGDSLFHYGEELPHITVSSTRKPEAIANDIVRRFLPDYDRMFYLALERKARRDDEHQRREELKTHLIEALDGREQPGENIVFKVGEAYGRITIWTTESICIKLEHAPTEIALSIAQALAQIKASTGPMPEKGK